MTDWSNPQAQAVCPNEIVQLMDAWAMDEPTVHRTLSRNAAERGTSAQELANRFVRHLNTVAGSLAPSETLLVGG